MIMHKLIKSICRLHRI